MERDVPLYTISIAAKLAGVHPQTLRIYEREKLISPNRTKGGTRLYSDEDIKKVRLIQELTQKERVNLAGVKIIISLKGEISELEALKVEMEKKIVQIEKEVEREIERIKRSFRNELVLMPKSFIVKR